MITGFVPRQKRFTEFLAAAGEGCRLVKSQPDNVLQALQVYDPSFHSRTSPANSDPNPNHSRPHRNHAAQGQHADISENTLQTTRCRYFAHSTDSKWKWKGLATSISTASRTSPSSKITAASSIYGSRATAVIGHHDQDAPKGSIQDLPPLNTSIQTPTSVVVQPDELSEELVRMLLRKDGYFSKGDHGRWRTPSGATC